MRLSTFRDAPSCMLTKFRFTNRGEDSGDTDTVFTTQDGTYNSGFHFKNPQIAIQYNIVNYNKEKKNIFLDLEIEYVDGLQGKDAGHVMKSVAGMIQTTLRANHI